MTFAHPKLIYLLVIPVTLLFWEWVRRGRPLVMPFDHVHKRRGWFRGLPVLAANSLPAVLLALAIVFLARPLAYAPPKTQMFSSQPDLNAAARSVVVDSLDEHETARTRQQPKKTTSHVQKNVFTECTVVRLL